MGKLSLGRFVPQRQNKNVIQTETNTTPKPKKSIRLRHLVGAAIIVALLAFFTVVILNKVLPRYADDGAQLSGVAKEYQQKLPGLKSAVDKDKNSAAARKEYAVALYATRDLDGAKKQYEAAVKIDGNDAVAYNNLANAYRDLGDTDKAVAAYEKSIELNPKSLNTYANLANVQLYTKKDVSSAVSTYKKGLQALPNNAQLELLLGIAYEQGDNRALALQTYRHILTYDAQNAAAKAATDRLDK